MTFLRLVTLAVLCVSFASPSVLIARIVSPSSSADATPSTITPNYNGAAISSGTSQIVVIDSGSGNVWSGGALTASDSCQINIYVTGSGNTITDPKITCSGECIVNVKVTANYNTLTTTTVNSTKASNRLPREIRQAKI